MTSKHLSFKGLPVSFLHQPAPPHKPCHTAECRLQGAGKMSEISPRDQGRGFCGFLVFPPLPARKHRVNKTPPKCPAHKKYSAAASH